MCVLCFAHLCTYLCKFACDIKDGVVDTCCNRYVEAWAKSYVKFIELWKEENVTFWGFTIQNEPGGDQFVGWNSLALSGAAEKKLVEGCVLTRTVAEH